MAPVSFFVMTDGFWQSLKLDVHIYIAISLMHGDSIMAVLQLMFCVNANTCVGRQVHRGRWAGVYIFERDKEVVSYKDWSMLHNVFIYWPSRFLYEPFYNFMISNTKNF